MEHFSRIWESRQAWGDSGCFLPCNLNKDLLQCGTVKIQRKSSPRLTTRKPCFLLIKKNLEVIPQLCLQVMSPAAPIYHPWRFFYTLMWKESGPIVISTTPTAVLSFANEALAPSMNQLSEKNSLPFLPIIYQRQGRETGFKASLKKRFPAHP